MKVLLCSFNTLGYINPLIGIGCDLLKKNHTVEVACESESKSIFERSGIRPLILKPEFSGAFKVDSFGNLSTVNAQIRLLQRICADENYDVIVTSPLAYGILIAAEIINIKVACVGFFSYLWPSNADVSHNNELLVRTKEWRLQSMLDNYNNCRSSLGLPAVQRDDSNLPFLGDLFLQRFIPSIVSQNHELPEKVKLVGSCMHESGELDPNFTDWLVDQEGQKIIYVNHGRTFNLPRFWNSLLDAFSNSEYSIAANVGRMDGKVDGEIPSNFYVADFIPAKQALSVSDLMMANGNSTAILSALEAAVPMLLLPGGGETSDNAHVCSQLGTASILDINSTTPSALYEEANSILSNPSYLRNCRNISSQMSSYGGFNRVTKELENLVVAI